MNLLPTLLLTALLTHAGENRGSMQVSATVRPAAKIEILSPTEVLVRVVLFPNTQALVWRGTGNCDSVQDPHVFAGSGAHRVTFAEVASSTTVVCVSSTDGAVRSQIVLDQ
jgi:hypothetical protein